MPHQHICKSTNGLIRMVIALFILDTYLSFLMCPEFHRRHAKVFFDVTAKERGVGEAKQVADLFDAIIGLLQVVADVLKYVFCNPFVSCLARVFLAKRREVFW